MIQNCQIVFNELLYNDPTSKFWLYYTNTFDTTGATLITDTGNTNISGYISGSTAITYFIDYSTLLDIKYTAISIGLDKGQYIRVDGTLYDNTNIIDISTNKELCYSNLSGISWQNIYNQPTTLIGYGITDAYNYYTTGATLSGNTAIYYRNDGEVYILDLSSIKTSELSFSAITNKPTTLSGYSIIDSYTISQVNNNFLSANTFLSEIKTNGINNIGNISATTYYGDGSHLSGINSTNTFTTGTTLSGTTAIFNRNDGVSYTLDLSSLKTTNLPFSAITQRPTTLNGYGITDAYNISDHIVIKNATKEHTGFLIPENVDLIYSSTARTITISGISQAMWRDDLITFNNWVSDPHPTGKTVNQYLYYNGSNYIWSDNVWTFDMLLIAIVVYYGPTVGFIGQRECHGLMQWQEHFSEHMTEGTWLLSGGASSGVTLGSTTVAQRRPTIAEVSLMDEDLKTINPPQTDKLYSQHYLSGITNIYSIDNADIVPLVGNIPRYNQLVGGLYQLTDLPTNGYMSVYRIDMPVTSDSTSQKMRSVYAPSQTINIGGNAASNATALASQLAIDPTTLNLGSLASPEFRIAYQYIIRYTALNWTIVAEQFINGSKNRPVLIQNSVGLTSVNSDGTLAGAGTIGDVLKVVDVNLAPRTILTGSLLSTNLDIINNKLIVLTASTILTASSWSGTTSQISVTGVTTTNEIYWDASTLADNILAGQANLFCSEQNLNSLTFICSTIPASDINIKVTIK